MSPLHACLLLSDLTVSLPFEISSVLRVSAQDMWTHMHQTRAAVPCLRHLHVSHQAPFPVSN